MEGIRFRSGSWAELGEPCRKLRQRVLVEEAGWPAGCSADNEDEQALHAVAINDGEVIACGRLLTDGRVDRLSVEASWRGIGIGGAILALLVEEARERGLPRVFAEVPTLASGFYRAIGFLAGEPPVGEGATEMSLPL